MGGAGGTGIQTIINTFDMSNTIESSDQQNTHVAPPPSSVNYFSILTEAIQNTERNSAQLRALVYERARFHLKREVLFGHSSLGLAELVRQINDLELAIARIEANAVDRPLFPAYRQPANAVEIRHAASDVAVQPVPPILTESANTDIDPVSTAEYFDPIPTRDQFGTNQGWETLNRHVRAATRLVSLVLIGFLFIGLVFMGSALWYFPKNSSSVATVSNETSVGDTTGRISEALSKVSEPASRLGAIADKVGAIAAAKVSEKVSPASISNGNSAASVNSSPKVPYPLPTAFGIYVLHNNKLTELETLPISVPDSRIAISAEIKKPSPLEISDPKPAFILFRRDLLNNAPQKIALRVVARMTRETKIVDGKAKVVDGEETWRIRNISREINVAPIPGQPEMVIARVDDNAPLAAGRYTLVLNRMGYDFKINGPQQSLEFCLEGFETKDGSVYSQCRAP